jgi:hypothetical protein
MTANQEPGECGTAREQDMKEQFGLKELLGSLLSTAMAWATFDQRRIQRCLLTTGEIDPAVAVAMIWHTKSSPSAAC